MDFNLSDLDCPQYVSFTNLSEDETPEKPPDIPKQDNIDVSKTANCSERDSSTSTVMLYQSLRSEDDESTVDQLTLEISAVSEISQYYPVEQGRATLDTESSRKVATNTTVPHPFKFQTDARIKRKETSTAGDTKDFASQLRQNFVLKALENHVTRVQPFNLHEGKKRKLEGDYVPLAEQVLAFQNKAPERFLTAPNKDFQPQGHWSPPAVVAKSPNLRAVKRRRLTTAISHKEKEENEIRAMKEYKFRARPVDSKIYAKPSTSQNVTLPVPKKAVVKRGSFPLITSARAAARRIRKRSEKQLQFQFHARPVPKNVLKGPSGFKLQSVIPITKPKPPLFASDERIEKRKLLDQKLALKRSKTEIVKKQKSQLTSTSTVSTTVYEKKPTKIKPFSFDQADRVRFSKKEKRIQEEIENDKKVPVFKAAFRPSPKKCALPVVPKRQPTEPKPFNFALASRVERNTTLCMPSELGVSFKANPATVLEKEPFVPVKAPKQKIEACEFSLHTNRRAEERQQLKEQQDAEEQEREKALQLQRTHEEEQERLEIARLRREIVHKAQPMPHFEHMEIMPSNKPLTQPQTPQFKTDKRLRGDNKHHDLV